MAISRYCRLQEQEFHHYTNFGSQFETTKTQLDAEGKLEAQKIFNTMEMVVSMYFPQLDEYLLALKSTIEHGKSGIHAKGPEIAKAFVDEIDERNDRLRRDEARIHTQISKIARSLLYRL